MLLTRKNACNSLSMQDAQTELSRDSSIHLIDVRSPEEYRQGHIPRSKNIPLDRISEMERLLPDKDAKLFVYCLSGARSRSACAQLAGMGYRQVTNIGGITQWPGEIER